MTTSRRLGANVLWGLGAAGVLATGAVHLYEYAADGFASVPTIGTLFLLNFIGATALGLAMAVPWRRAIARRAWLVRDGLALSGIGLAASSLVALWISETSSLFGFSDFGFRAPIVVAIVAESVTLAALPGFLVLAHLPGDRGARAAEPGGAVTVDAR